MDDKEHYERGMAMRRKTLGSAHVDRANANKTPFNAEFQDLITRYLWGIWTRPHFDVRTRRVLVIGTLMALGHWEEFRTHVRGARGSLAASCRCSCGRSARSGRDRRSRGRRKSR